MTKEKLRKKMLAKNDYDWYVVNYEDGDMRLLHNTGLSSILECGQNPKNFGITRIERCGSV